jgi:uncharacterized membrane protein YcaP (DUF421 family)
MEFINEVFGAKAGGLTTGQMIARGIVIFFITLAFIRISGVRTLGKKTAFDYLTALILGAIMGRAVVTIEQPFLPSIVASLVIMLLHRGVAWVTYLSKRAGKVLKGEPMLLIKDGKKNKANLIKADITEEDIIEALRLKMNMDSLDKVKEVYLERSGEISFVV